MVVLVTCGNVWNLWLRRAVVGREGVQIWMFEAYR
jgi:hypothetical protein